MRTSKIKQRSKANNRPRSKGHFPSAGNRSGTATYTRVAPDELDVKLLYRDFRTVTNGLSPIAAKAFHTNAAYDVDPALGSTETYGFDEYAALYSYYRVISYEYEITVVNPTSYVMMAYVLNTNVDPTLSGSRFDLYSTNPHCQSKLITYISPNTHTFRGRHQIAQIVGTPSIEMADSFRSVTTGVPSDLTWITVAAECLSPAADISFSYDLKLTMRTRFYGREVDLSLAALSARISARVVARLTLKYEKERKALEAKASGKS